MASLYKIRGAVPYNVQSHLKTDSRGKRYRTMVLSGAYADVVRQRPLIDLRIAHDKSKQLTHIVDLQDSIDALLFEARVIASRPVVKSAIRLMQRGRLQSISPSFIGHFDRKTDGDGNELRCFYHMTELREFSLTDHPANAAAVAVLVDHPRRITK